MTGCDLFSGSKLFGRSAVELQNRRVKRIFLQIRENASGETAAASVRKRWSEELS